METTIHRANQATKTDGVVIRRERARLAREQNRTSYAIYCQKNDVQIAH